MTGLVNMNASATYKNASNAMESRIAYALWRKWRWRHSDHQIRPPTTRMNAARMVYAYSRYDCGEAATCASRDASAGSDPFTSDIEDISLPIAAAIHKTALSDASGVDITSGDFIYEVTVPTGASSRSNPEEAGCGAMRGVPNICTTNVVGWP